MIATKLRVDEHTVEHPVGAQVREHLEASLTRLGTDRVELYYLHRINPKVPVEEVAQVMGRLIEEGKIRGWGLSQCSALEIRRAYAVAPLTAVQSEYSMMERMFERDVIPLCEELRIGFVPFSPLASGFLSGRVRADDRYQGDDVRRVITRFYRANIAANQPLLDLLHRLADERATHTDGQEPSCATVRCKVPRCHRQPMTARGRGGGQAYDAILPSGARQHRYTIATTGLPHTRLGQVVDVSPLGSRTAQERNVALFKSERS